MIPDEAPRVERVLATARAFMAVASLIAIYIDPTEPSRFVRVAYSLMVLYVIYSLFVFLLVRWRPATVRFRLGFHALDILWPTLIALFTSGTGSVFFLYYTFVLLAAAYRWGLTETLTTACVIIVLFLSEGFLGASSTRLSFLLGEGGFDINRFLMRSIDLLIFGYLLGYLGEKEKQLRQEAWYVAHLIREVQASPGLSQAVGVVLSGLARHFDADRCLLAVSNERTEETVLWQTNPKARGRDRAVSMRNLGSAEKAAYTFKLSWAAWHGVMAGSSFDLRILDRQGRWLRERWTPPVDWMEFLPLEGVLVVAVDYGKEWSGSLLLFGDRHLSDDERLRRLQSLIIQTSPALYGVYLTQRLRSRAGAAERARVARELHDGVIQSLVGIEMQVDVLRRLPPPEERLSGELERIQSQLRQEVLNVRELMEQMRSVDIGPRQLADYLAQLVDKFWRDTGIAASFSCSVDEIALQPRACHEVARITQEALANVRRHSGARHVVVSVGQEDGKFKLVVDDDGQGFSFPGRLAQAELDAHHKGPVVIKERVRAVGGELVVDSRPGEGARLEVTIPGDAYV